MSVAGEQPTKEQIARWIKELGDDDFTTRQEASRRLWEAGQAAENAVLEAAKSSDAEVSRRARALRDKFRWGIYPDTPPNVVELIQRYRGADLTGKQVALKELLALGSAGCTALLKIAPLEPDAVLRSRLFQQIALEAARTAPALIQAGEFATLERLLEIGIAADQIPNYVACILLQGKLDEKIAVYTTRTEQEDGKRAAEVLAYLYRAKGDMAAARRAAMKSGHKELEEAILFEAGDWKALAALDLSDNGRRQPELLGFKAAYQRLAGNTKAFEETTKRIQALYRPTNANDWGAWHNAWYSAKALLLNDRPNEALTFLGSRRAEAFEILCAQMRFREALDLVDKAKEEATAEAPLLEVLQARTLYQLGEKNKSAKLLADLAGRIRQGENATWPEKLIEVEYRLGLEEQAFEHCARALSMTKDAGRQIRLMEKVFPSHGETAASLWFFRRQKASEEPPATTMRRLRDVLEGKLRDRELKDFLALPPNWAPPRDQLAKGTIARLEVFLNAEMDLDAKLELISAITDHVAPYQGYMHFGDHLAGQKQWMKAAEYYAKAWNVDQKELLPLYLRGWALLQAGEEKEGKRLMELAHWLPLGNESLRARFLRDLARRHHRDAVLREAELLSRVSVPGSFHAGDGFHQLAIDALRRGDHDKTAAYYERAMLRCLQAQTNFADTTAYLAVPHFVHRHRARALIEANRIDEALKEADLCLAALPGNSDLQALLVPELAKRGRTVEAEALFARCYDLYAKLCQECPNSAWAHNGLAWLCASTRRRLDAGLDHARKAVELEPTHPGYRDTLAEIHFQRGDKDKAIAESKRSIARDDKRVYFKKQLKRFEAGDPQAELPSPLDED
jgi:predicted Zn-dependent protease